MSQELNTTVPYDLQSEFNDRIKPLVEQIGVICQELSLPFVMAFNVNAKNEGEKRIGYGTIHAGLIAGRRTSPILMAADNLLDADEEFDIHLAMKAIGHRAGAHVGCLHVNVGKDEE